MIVIGETALLSNDIVSVSAPSDVTSAFSFKVILSEEASFVAGFILVFSLFLYLTFDARNQKDKPAKTT